MTKEDFWCTRAKQYDNLKWVRDSNYMEVILDHALPNPDCAMLDLGVGTGQVASAFLPYVKSVTGIDISFAMAYNLDSKIEFIKGNIYELKKIFKFRKFDLITARMVFHHCHTDLDSIIKNCYKLLNKAGRLVIAESIPPSKNSIVKNWWHEVRLLKEKRTSYFYPELAQLLMGSGFVNINSEVYISPLEKSSTVNWLDSSGLGLMTKYRIIKAHLGAPKIVKRAHKMKITENDILCEHRHLIISGQK